MQNSMQASSQMSIASQSRLIAMATTGIPVETMSRILAIPTPEVVSWLKEQPVPSSITLPESATDVTTLYEYMIFVTTSRARADMTASTKARHLRSLLLNSAIEVVEGGTPQTLRSLSDALAVVHRVAQDEDDYGNKRAENIGSSTTAAAVVHVNLGGLLQPRDNMGGVIADGGLQSRPVLNANSQVVGVQSGDEITPLVSMSPSKLRELAGTDVSAAVRASAAVDARRAGAARLKSVLQEQAKPWIDPNINVDALFDGVELPS